jgi:FkbM family methyltransferase
VSARLINDLLIGIFRMLPFRLAVLLSKQLLVAQGFGAGGHISSSGETGVFRLVKANAPTLFDVGGHVGEYSEAFLSAFPRGRSYIFEPSANHVEMLRRRLGARPEVAIFPLGLGPEAGTLPLYKDRDISGLASLSQRRLEHFNVRMDQVEMVTISTIDTIVAEISLSAIDLLKLDVEGHEFSVLRGATKAMERGIIKLVQFEFGGCNLDTRTNLQDFFYFFKSFNFVIGLVQPGGGIQLLEHYDEFYEQYQTTNFVAAPRATLVS